MFRFANIGTVTLIVGPTKTQFIVHEHIICAASRYFTAAILSGFRESEEKTITWGEEKVEAVDFLVRWLYRRQESGMVSKESLEPQPVDELLDVYFLADKCQITDLKTLVIDQLVSKSLAAENTFLLSLCQMERIYANTTSKSGLRRFLLARVIRNVRKSWFEKEEAKQWLIANPEIAADFVGEFATNCLDMKSVALVAGGYYDPE